jgi:hypothetical protein
MYELDLEMLQALQQRKAEVRRLRFKPIANHQAKAAILTAAILK